MIKRKKMKKLESIVYVIDYVIGFHFSLDFSSPPL